MSEKISFLIRYFVPHHSNNYKGKALHVSSLVFYAVALLFFQSLSSLIASLSGSVLGYATDVSVEKVLMMVNAEREREGLHPLVLSAELNSAAQSKAEDMFEKNYWAHISPTGKTPWEFITASGYKYTYAGENLAKDFDYSGDVVAAWMKSPTHRANIMKKEYKEIGLAVVNGRLNGSDTTLVVQEFGTRDLALADKKRTDKESTPPKVLEAYNPPEQRLASPFFFPFGKRQISILVAELLLLVMLVDAYYIWKNRVMRLSGHTLSHIIFLIALIGAMSFTGIGVIL